MNRKIYKYYIAGIILVTLTLLYKGLTAPGKSQLIVEEGFESGTLPFKASGNAPEVIATDDARAGKYVMKSQLNQKSKIAERTELSINKKNVNFDIGKEYWVGISIKLGEDFRNRSDLYDQGMLLQWHYRDWLHPEVRGAQPLVLRYRGGKVHVHNEVLQEYMASVSPAYGEWVDWVIHVKFSNTDRIIQVWRNGRKIVDWVGDNHQEEKHEGAYLKFGLYSFQYAKMSHKPIFTRTVYHDELRIAGAEGSYELVVPRNRELNDEQ